MPRLGRISSDDLDRLPHLGLVEAALVLRAALEGGEGVPEPDDERQEREQDAAEP